MIYATYNTISFEWFDPADDGGTPILDFQVYWNQGVDGNDFTLLQDSTLGMNTYFIQNGLTNGVFYQFKVKASNYIGLSPFSSYINLIAASVPLEPLNLQIVLLTVDSVKFSWDENPDNGGSLVKDYHIYWDEGNPDSSVTDFVLSDHSSYQTREH
jgi:hypothetical protein